MDALCQANEQIDQYRGQTDKAKQRREWMTIQSPVDGIPTESEIYNTTTAYSNDFRQQVLNVLGVLQRFHAV